MVGRKPWQTHAFQIGFVRSIMCNPSVDVIRYDYIIHFLFRSFIHGSAARSTRPCLHCLFAANPCDDVGFFCFLLRNRGSCASFLWQNEREKPKATT